MSVGKTTLVAAAFVSLLAWATPLPAQDTVLQMDAANTKIEFTLGDVLHTVRGTFQLKSGTVRFAPNTGVASGSVVVDVTSGNTGSKPRDRRMHNEILESQTYPEAVFTPTKVTGALASQGNSTVQVDGNFRLHGADHPMTLSFMVTVNGDSFTATTHMVIPYVAWGMKNPSTFILRVSEKVDLAITAAGHLETSGSAEPKSK